MQVIRGRFDLIATLRSKSPDDFLLGETSAFHARKIVEAIAFACLIAIENGLKAVPRDAVGKWNAEDIFKSLKSKGLDVLPNPSQFREATGNERVTKGAIGIIESTPFQRLTHQDLIEIYRRLHAWSHEINPYAEHNHASFHRKHSQDLWEDLIRLQNFLEKHYILIKGQGFLCELHGRQDGQTKVMALAKSAT